jgi:branched-chain amino acid transport system permease protein
MRRWALIGLRMLVAVGAVVLVVVLPHWLSDFRAVQFARAGVFFIAIVGLNVLIGYTGQISLGHGALMAIGGYASAILVNDLSIRDVWTIPLAGAITAVAGFIVGLPALRLRGLYLALVTFALAVAMPSLLQKFHFTGGTGGINLFEKRLPHLTGAVSGTVTVFGHTFTQNDFFYYLSWGIGLVLFGVAWLIVRGRVGRAFRALRDSEVAAISSGVNLSVYKTLAFTISGFYAGVAGALYMMLANWFVVPQTYPFSLSLWLVVGAVVGGLWSLAGLVLGALFVEFLPTWTPHLSSAPGAPTFFYGLAIVVVIMLLPTGAGGLLKRLVDPLTTRLYTRS